MKSLPRVLFVSQTGRPDQPYADPSLRYRCFNPAEEIRRLGGVADVVAMERFDRSFIDNYDHFVFHRPTRGKGEVKEALEVMRAKGKTYHADYDDLIFAPDYALQSSIFLNGVRSRESTLAIFNGNLDGFREFDRFTVSTRPLARHVQRLNPQATVEVIPNGLSTAFLKSLELKICANHVADRLSGPRFAISYLSGTNSHRPDFAFIQEVLARFLERNPCCCLMVAGPLEFDQEVFPRESMRRMGHKPYPEFLATAGRFMLNIAPLAPGNEFNECKSGLKFFESGIFGVPTLASPIDDFMRFADSPGLSLPATIVEWEAAMNQMLDPDHYRRSVEGLREYCWNNCRCESAAQSLLDFCRKAG